MCYDARMNWNVITPRIDWTRCLRRRWPPAPRLDFTPQERRKQRNVLLYFWAGRGHRQLPGGPAAIHPGVCHWSRPGWNYTGTQSARNPLGVTAIHFDLLDRRGRVIPPTEANLPPERLTVRSPQLVDDITRWIAERAMEARAGIALPPALAVAGQHLLHGLLRQLVHDNPPGGGAEPALAGWRQLVAHVHDHLHDFEGVGRLADRAGYSRSHFSRVFRQQTGLGPEQYVINARIALAKELLRSSMLSMSEIAARAGYGDIYQFSRQFRQRTGLTPSAYRARARA